MIALKYTCLLFSFFALFNAISLSLYAMDDLAIAKQRRTPETLKHLCFTALAKKHYAEQGILADFTKTLEKSNIPNDLKENFARWITEKPFYPNALYKSCMTKEFYYKDFYYIVEDALKTNTTTAEDVLQIIELCVKHPNSLLNIKYAHAQDYHHKKDQLVYVRNIIHAKDAYHNYVEQSIASNKQLCSEAFWDHYAYIFAGAPLDARTAIAHNDNDFKEKIIKELQIQKSINDHNDLMCAVLSHRISPIPTIRELVQYASHDKHYHRELLCYNTLQKILLLDNISPWFNTLRALWNESSLFHEPTKHAQCNVLALLLKHKLLKPDNYDPFKELLRYRCSPLTDKQLEYIDILMEHGIKPAPSNLEHYHIETLDILLKKYPSLAPAICNTALKQYNPIPYIPLIKQYGTPENMATLLAQRSSIDIIELLKNDYPTILTAVDIQTIEQSAPNKLKFPLPNNVPDIETIGKHGNPFIALLAAGQGSIAKDTIPQLLRKNTHRLLSTHLQRSLVGMPFVREEIKPIWDYYKHIVQCQIDLEDDQKSTIDLTKLEKSILEQQSIFQKYGNALLLGIGKPFSLLLQKLSSYFADKKKNTTETDKTLRKPFVSSLHFTGDYEKNNYAKAMQLALYQCVPLSADSKLGSPYFEFGNPDSDFEYYGVYRENNTYYSYQNIKDLRPIENLVLGKTPWYERHGNKIFSLYCGLLAAGSLGIAYKNG